jgi:Restriction endonuclease fold toxin 9
MRFTTRRMLLASMATLLLSGLLLARAENYSDFKSAAEKWIAATRDIYTLDAKALDLIWQAYCGGIDTGYGYDSDEAKKGAAEIGYNWQQQQLSLMKNTRPDLADLRKRADVLIAAEPDSQSDIKDWLSKMQDEEKKLDALDNGLVLKGSGHPFTQYALEYGKKQHQYLCDQSSGAVKICDKTFDGLSGRRPDLVVINSDGLMVYEFKPDNAGQISKGEDQLDDYHEAVLDYYQQFFPDGRGKGFKGEPDSDHGGKAMLEAIDKNDRAWHSDTELEVGRHIVTYKMCEKQF